jgi:hypothetical protein
MTFLIMQSLLILPPYAQPSPSTPYFRTCLTNFHICTVHLDTIRVYYSPTNAQVIVLKTILKFKLK